MKLAGAYIQDDTYERLAALAAANNRTLAGECRHLFDRALRGELEVPACAPVLGAAGVKAEAHAGASGSGPATAAMPAAAAAALAAPQSARGVSAEMPAAQGGKCGGVCSGRCAKGERAARAASPAV